MFLWFYYFIFYHFPVVFYLVARSDCAIINLYSLTKLGQVQIREVYL